MITTENLDSTYADELIQRVVGHIEYTHPDTSLLERIGYKITDLFHLIKELFARIWESQEKIEQRNIRQQCDRLVCSINAAHPYEHMLTEVVTTFSKRIQTLDPSLKADHVSFLFQSTITALSLTRRNPIPALDPNKVESLTKEINGILGIKDVTDRIVTPDVSTSVAFVSPSNKTAISVASLMLITLVGCCIYYTTNSVKDSSPIVNSTTNDSDHPSFLSTWKAATNHLAHSTWFSKDTSMNLSFCKPHDVFTTLPLDAEIATSPLNSVMVSALPPASTYTEDEHDYITKQPLSSTLKRVAQCLSFLALSGIAVLIETLQAYFSKEPHLKPSKTTHNNCTAETQKIPSPSSNQTHKTDNTQKTTPLATPPQSTRTSQAKSPNSPSPSSNQAHKTNNTQKTTPLATPPRSTRASQAKSPNSPSPSFDSKRGNKNATTYEQTPSVMRLPRALKKEPLNEHSPGFFEKLVSALGHTSPTNHTSY